MSQSVFFVKFISKKFEKKSATFFENFLGLEPETQTGVCRLENSVGKRYTKQKEATTVRERDNPAGGIFL